MEMKNGEGRLFLILRTDQSRYAVPAGNVAEIIPIPDVTVLPKQPGYLRGIFSYKGHAATVLSLQGLCGRGTGGEETVCVVIRMDDILFGLTADSTDELVPDSGQRMQADTALMEGKLLRLDFVMPGEPAVFVLDLPKTYEAIKTGFHAETSD